jgi:hypothetical protein
MQEVLVCSLQQFESKVSLPLSLGLHFLEEFLLSSEG